MAEEGFHDYTLATKLERYTEKLSIFCNLQQWPETAVSFMLMSFQHAGWLHSWSSVSEDGSSQVSTICSRVCCFNLLSHLSRVDTALLPNLLSLA
jgi:hypothetical protein